MAIQLMFEQCEPHNLATSFMSKCGIRGGKYSYNTYLINNKYTDDIMNNVR